MVRKKNWVIFEEEGGDIVNLKNGKRITSFEHEGAYLLRVKIRPPTKSTVATKTSDVARSGRCICVGYVPRSLAR